MNSIVAYKFSAQYIAEGHQLEMELKKTINEVLLGPETPPSHPGNVILFQNMFHFLLVGMQKDKYIKRKAK